MSDQKPSEEVRQLAWENGVYIEPDPIPNERPSAHDLVCIDLQRRKNFGLAKYGIPLQAFNGRKSLNDAYDEVQDLIVYLRTEIEERDIRGQLLWEFADRLDPEMGTVLRKIVNGEITRKRPEGCFNCGRMPHDVSQQKCYLC